MPQFRKIPGPTKYQTSLCTRLHSGGYTWRLNVPDKSQKTALQALAGPEAASGLTAGNQGAPLPQSHLDLIPFLAGRRLRTSPVPWTAALPRSSGS
jgi:hypothetical protein